MIPRSEWSWFGHAGHCIISDQCMWHLHTEVGNFRISTIGDYYTKNGERETLGADPESWFETMVFRLSDDPCGCGCGAREPSSWSEVECQRHASRLEARHGHVEMCLKYAGVDKC